MLLHPLQLFQMSICSIYLSMASGFSMTYLVTINSLLLDVCASWIHLQNPHADASHTEALLTTELPP